MSERDVTALPLDAYVRRECIAFWIFGFAAGLAFGIAMWSVFA